MKYWFKARRVACVLALVLLAGSVGRLALAQETASSFVVNVGLYDNEPKLWKDERGQAQGLFPDIINAIAENEGWRVNYVYGSWEDGLRNLATNAIDIMPDVALSDERAEEYDFNEETVLVNWGVLYSRRGLNVESIADLQGKSVAILKSGIHYSGPFGLKTMLDAFDIEAEIVDVKEYSEIFNLMDGGKVDFGVVNRTFGIANEGQHAVVRTHLIFNPTELRLAFTKGSPANDYLIGRIDDNLRRMKADNGSIYHEALLRHLGGLVERVEVVPPKLVYALIIGGVAMLILLVGCAVRFVIRRGQTAGRGMKSGA